VFQPIREAAGCEWATMHSLRHAMSSILASHRASAKHIAERLGVGDVQLTLDRYAHLDRVSQAQAASIFDDVFAGKKRTRRMTSLLPLLPFLPCMFGERKRL
jgi:integrase